jgi:hypothetical protein
VEMRAFCGGCYVVAGIDQEDFEAGLFGDNDVQCAEGPRERPWGTCQATPTFAS